jgi:3D (Asp-Asp-Asp) domain-containing protein
MQKPISTAKRATSSGHVMIEAAFIFIVFFSMLIGTFDFGQFLFIHQALVERARYAVRWGAVNDATTSDITNMVLYQSTTAGTSGYFNLTSSNVTVTKTTDSICMVADPTVFPTLYKRLSVQIHDYSYVMISPYSAGTYNGPNITIAAPIELDFTSPETSHC